MKKILPLIITVVFTNFSLGQSELPLLNQKITGFVKSVIGKKVDRGECWDLANAALMHAGAYFDKSSKKSIYVYGKEVDPDKQNIYPGDLIQFEKVKLKYIKDNVEYREEMTHHTAIVYKVYSPGKYQIAHQNTGFSGRKVGVSDLDLKNVTKGKLKFYRPVE